MQNELDKKFKKKFNNSEDVQSLYDNVTGDGTQATA